MQHHKYSLTELEEMMPWEREIYINLLMQWLEEEKERQKQQNAQTSQTEKFFSPSRPKRKNGEPQWISNFPIETVPFSMLHVRKGLLEL